MLPVHFVLSVMSSPLRFSAMEPGRLTVSGKADEYHFACTPSSLASILNLHLPFKEMVWAEILAEKMVNMQSAETTHLVNDNIFMYIFLSELNAKHSSYLVKATIISLKMWLGNL